MTRNPKGSFFFILTVSLKDLFNIFIHKSCFSLQNSLISSPLNIDETNPFEFFGDSVINSVSTLTPVAGSILTTLGE